MTIELIYKEIDEGTSQAAVDLGNGYKIQILRDDVSGNSVCNLYTPQGSILDGTECDSPEEIQDFITISENLLEDIAFWDSAFEDEVELVKENIEKFDERAHN